ncbi:MAG TPA: phage tail protein [Agriterribacter sp.]|nr:phage tail protein [Agriterribacter sp.]
MNLKRLEPDFKFILGEVYNTDYKNITFNADNCLSALGKIAEAFQIEYYIDGETIHLTNRMKDTGYQFRHGKQKGMYEVTRKTVDSTSVVTRIYPFGSDKNLPEGYRNFSKRLKMAPQPRSVVSEVTYTTEFIGGNVIFTFNWTAPNIEGVTGVRILSRRYSGITRSYGQFGKPSDGSATSPRTYTSAVSGVFIEFVFQTMVNDLPGPVSGKLRFLGGADAGNPSLPLPVTEVFYLEKNIDKYGVSEAVRIFDEIYPHRTGAVTSINAGNVYQFHDSGIDFDLNAHLLPGMTAKVTFNTGQLTGYTFDIKEYDHSTRRVTILKNKNERAIDIPSEYFKPAIGDKYVFTDIRMPQSYIDAAEELLKLEAQKVLDIVSEPQLAYQIVFDPVYLKTKRYSLDIGQLIWIVDADLEVQRKMRIVSLSRNIIEETTYEVEISDTLSKGKIEALISGQTSNSNSISNLNSAVQNNSILNNRVIGDLIMTGNASIKFEGLQSKSDITLIGVDVNGRIFLKQ